jgi:hypothetical protein
MFRKSLLTLVALATLLGGARAQWGGDTWATQMLRFDQQFDQYLNGLMATNQSQMQQLLQQVAADPRVQAAYRQYLASGYPALTYEQFVYYWVLTAGGTDPQGGLRAQQDAFQGLQQAHATVQSGFDGLNQGWWDTQGRVDQTMQDYSEHAIRGNVYYESPATGETYALPYTSGPGYYQSGQALFYHDALGQYWQWVGNDWQRLTPRGP